MRREPRRYWTHLAICYLSVQSFLGMLLGGFELRPHSMTHLKMLCCCGGIAQKSYMRRPMILILLVASFQYLQRVVVPRRYWTQLAISRLTSTTTSHASIASYAHVESPALRDEWPLAGHCNPATQAQRRDTPCNPRKGKTGSGWRIHQAISQGTCHVCCFITVLTETHSFRYPSIASLRDPRFLFSLVRVLPRPYATFSDIHPEENLKLLSAQVHPIDSNSVPYAFSSSACPTLSSAARALNLPTRSSKSYLSLFGVQPAASLHSSRASSSPANAPNAPLDDRYTGHIIVSGYNIAYILPKDFPPRFIGNESALRVSTFSAAAMRRHSVTERSNIHFMAAVDLFVPFASRPPRAPFLVRAESLFVSKYPTH